jgi:hypothetical protein
VSEEEPEQVPEAHGGGYHALLRFRSVLLVRAGHERVSDLRSSFRCSSLDEADRAATRPDAEPEDKADDRGQPPERCGTLRIVFL